MAGAFEPPVPSSQDGEADLRAIAKSLWAKKALILGPTLLAAAAALFIAGSLTPLYRSEARVLVESNDTVYTRPEGATTGEQRAADELEVQSQVQLLLSRDLAREVAKDLKLSELEEFDMSDGPGLLKRLMVLVGVSRDPMSLNSDERLLDAFYERLNVYAVMNSRVIVVEFSSSNPETAANVANAVAERYLARQQVAKQTTTRRASDWLSTQIDELSANVAKAEAKVEEFRAKSNLFLGSNNATITTQQLGELNTELSRARAQQADAQAKATLIQNALETGGPVESLDVANSELLRQLSQQRVGLAATIAREGRTYLPGHPRMKELQAQINALDAQIKEEGRKLARAYENEADVAASRVASVQRTIDAQKELVGSAGGQEVQLRALEREAKAQRDLLEQFLARYREAAARERVEAIPPDARIISRAMPNNSPYWPKPLAITVLTALGVFVLLVIGVTASEFMAVPARAATPAPAGPAAPPSGSRRSPRAVDSAPPAVVPPAAAAAAPKAEFPDAATADAAKMPETVQPEAPAVRAVAPTLAAAAALTPKPAMPQVFGGKPAGSAPASPAGAAEIETADMRMLGELAAHLASMPKSEQGALNILAVAAASAIDAGSAALSLARALAGAGRKAIVVDAGSGSRDFAAALPNPGEGGLGELIAGNTSFGQAIQRDRASAAHLIAPGAAGLLDAAALSRIGIVFDALGLTYDFVIVLSPSADRAEEMKELARRMGAAILVSNAQDAATTAAHGTLVSAGIGDVILLLAAAQPTAVRPAERAS